MSEKTEAVVSAETATPKLADSVVEIAQLDSEYVSGCRVFVHFNGPTDMLSGMCTGMAVLDPGASPHPPHRHPEEEFLIVSEGTGEIECDGKTTQVGPGAIMYCAGNVLHGITNTGKVPMTFYWSKWLAKGH
jgi:mannose-6-phosphate isomerase-like protein (cupin superfamily)